MYFLKIEMGKITPSQFLENTYAKALSLVDVKPQDLTVKQFTWVKSIVDKEESLKGVYILEFQ